MNAFLPLQLMPERASTMAQSVDALFLSLLAVTGLVAGALALLVILFGIRYRRGASANRTPPGTSGAKLEVVWTLGPLGIFFGIFVWAAVVYFHMARPPEDSLEIHVVAKQWMWKLQHPSGRREINALHVPLGRPVALVMISQDVIHSFFVPAFRAKQDVLPGRYTRVWFNATKPGTYPIFCAEYCGTEHSQMTGFVTVMQPAEYARWLETGDVSPSMIAQGRRLFLSRGCSGCHSTRSTIPAPLLDGIYGKPVALSDGATIVADDTYLRDSILLPNKHVVGGFKPEMPTFQGQLDEEEITQLIAYLRSLHTPSDLPP